MPALISFDTETHLIVPGRLDPKPVVASFHDGNQSWMERFHNSFDSECAEETIAGLLAGNAVVTGANLAYDWAVVMRRVPSLVKDIFRLYEQGRVWDVQIVAALHAIADGRMLDGSLLDFYGRQLRENGNEGRLTTRFSLLNCVYLYLGRLDAKKNDEYRLRYGELEGLPTSIWPAEARQYPLDDAKNAYDVAMAQAETAGNLGRAGPLNISWPAFQARAAFAMHLGSVVGLRTNAKRVAELEGETNKTLIEDTAKFRAWGFLKPDGRENRSLIKRVVAWAYGADAKRPCKMCSGTGKVPSQKTGKPVNCKACDSTGIELPASVPRTPADGISTDRDTLSDAHDAQLEDWAEASKSDKMRETYLPWLKQGVDTPLNVRSNVLVASGRCSYDGLIQLIPPKAREAIVPPPGQVFCSVDYPSLELCTLAQVTYSVLGYSRMRDVINQTGDPGALHTEFGAKMAGIDINNANALAAFARAARVKGSVEERFRFMAKAGNFGFPGGMGVPTLVLAKRKEGLRFCVASGRNTKCAKPVLEWRGRQLDKPTCPDCMDVAASLRESWFGTWPEIKPYFAWVSAITGLNDGRGVLTTPVTGFVRGGLSFTSAANHSFQHLGACAAKDALWHVTKEAYCDEASPLYGSRPLALVHDEIFFQTPRAGMLAAGFRCAEIMREALQRWTPDVKAPLPEPAFMDHWNKKAVLVRDEKTGEPLDEVWQPKESK